MSRLIDADELISKLVYDVRLDSALLDENDISELRREHIQFDKDCKMNAIEFVREERTVDAVPVKHGKWIIRDNPGTGWYRVTCSECGEDVTATAPCIGFYPNARVTWNYCPECGARMDEND